MLILALPKAAYLWKVNLKSTFYMTAGMHSDPVSRVTTVNNYFSPKNTAWRAKAVNVYLLVRYPLRWRWIYS